MVKLIVVVVLVELEEYISKPLEVVVVLDQTR